MNAPFSLGDYYITSVGTGLRSLVGRYPLEAAARVVNPLAYPRLMEYQLTLGQLGPFDDCKILDVGSPKLPLLILARQSNTEIHSTDVRDYFIGPTSLFLRRNGLGHRLGKDVLLEVEDARRLSYADGYFDCAFSISVIEHIPDDGDARAMREIARVLRPGGVVTLTVPFDARGLRDEYVDGGVYERAATDAPSFYQRHYDDAALHERLIEPSGLRLESTVYFGEPGLRFEPTWNRISMRWKLPFLWAQPFLARLFLRTLLPHQRHAASGVALKLQKPD